MHAEDISLKELQKIVHDFCIARDWDQFHNPKDLAISLSLEASEVLEQFQWKNNKEIDEYLNSHKNDIADELVDVLYWILLLSNKLDIDLVGSFNKKMLANEAKYPIEKSKGNHKKYTEL